MVDLLERLVRGERMDEIAAAWSVKGPRVVQKTAAGARQALGARTLPHAVAIYVQRNGHHAD